jgi:glycosyltransferase involved in cell wall biosynthesis
VKWTVLSIAYPLAVVGGDAVGGAEQVLARLDCALTEAGHQSIVVAVEGSTVTGTLVATPRLAGPLDQACFWSQHQRHREAIAAALGRWPVDLVHMHGVDFDHYLPPDSVPTLVTLHLPPESYAPGALRLPNRNVRLHCVSRTQRLRCPAGTELLDEIPNGVPVSRLDLRLPRRRHALALGRICPEKGFHLALEAAARAGVPLLLAGQVHPYPAHEHYFRQEIVPRLDEDRRFIGPVGFARKRELLASARCLLVTSQTSETSSLVAMESLACGTPVVGFPRGALPEIVEHGRTGFLVEDVAAMAEAIRTAGRLDPEACRAAARERFSDTRMVERYFSVYRSLIERSARSARPLVEAHG